MSTNGKISNRNLSRGVLRILTEKGVHVTVKRAQLLNIFAHDHPLTPPLLVDPDADTHTDSTIVSKITDFKSSGKRQSEPMGKKKKPKYDMKKVGTFLKDVKSECKSLFEHGRREKEARRVWKECVDAGPRKEAVGIDQLSEMLFGLRYAHAHASAKMHVTSVLLRTPLYSSYFGEMRGMRFLPLTPQLVPLRKKLNVELQKVR